MQPRPIVGSPHRVVPNVLFCIGLVSSQDLLISCLANACHRQAAETFANASKHWMPQVNGGVREWQERQVQEAVTPSQSP